MRNFRKWLPIPQYQSLAPLWSSLFATFLWLQPYQTPESNIDWLTIIDQFALQPNINVCGSLVTGWSKLHRPATNCFIFIPITVLRRFLRIQYITSFALLAWPACPRATHRARASSGVNFDCTRIHCDWPWVTGRTSQRFNNSNDNNNNSNNSSNSGRRSSSKSAAAAAVSETAAAAVRRLLRHRCRHRRLCPHRPGRLLNPTARLLSVDYHQPLPHRVRGCTAPRPDHFHCLRLENSFFPSADTNTVFNGATA